MSSPNKELRVSTEVAEFMLDLPEGTTIVGASYTEGKLILNVKSDFDFPEVANLVYANDENGTSALVGAEPA
jgi:hypothetical protein